MHPALVSLHRTRALISTVTSIVTPTVGFVYRLRMDNLQSLLVCENHAAAVKRISFAPDASDRFATLSSDCTIRVWYDGLGAWAGLTSYI